MNDPYGIRWAEGAYRLFYQYVPGSTSWRPQCHWGQASSLDLVHWTEGAVALTPGEGEIGCWSGSVVDDVDGSPVSVYTRIATADYGQGAVALARGSYGAPDWRRSPQQAVIAGPPPQLKASAFRDPFVWRDASQWRMIIGAALPDGEAAALSYTSPDLTDWEFGGVLASRNTRDISGAWTGELWECPQLVRFGGQAALVVSVWNDDTLHYVAYGIGAYDGQTFSPESWNRLSYGEIAYAASLFHDRDGGTCLIAWLREGELRDPGREHAGALSIVYQVTMVEGQLITRPHPAVMRAFGDGRIVVAHADEPTEVSIDGASATMLTFECAAGSAPELEIRLVAGTKPVAHFRIERREGGAALVDGDGAVLLPVAATEDFRVGILLDADIVEVWCPDGSGFGAARLRGEHGPVTSAEVSGGQGLKLSTRRAAGREGFSST